jgi:hypothetical protein
LPLCACPTTATLRISLPWYVFIVFLLHLLWGGRLRQVHAREKARNLMWVELSYTIGVNEC